MCGIAGAVFPESKPERIDRGTLRAVLERLAHRGPDDQGFLVCGPRGVEEGRDPPESVSASVVLLHRRLSIIDLSERGHQPMRTRDGACAVVYNGEIYNHVELRKELEGRGRRFESTSDTEVLLQAWLEWGEDALPRLTGMFAFALLDRSARRLVLARDPFGIKPLYTAEWRGGLAFASEIPALLALEGVSRRVNATRLADYLSSGLTDEGDETLFAAIRQVPAGHLVSVSLEAPHAPAPRRFFALEPREAPRLSRAEAALRVRERFLENVRLHMRSDVPLGAALSGGIDSSSIVMAMRRVGGAGAELHAFSYIAADPAVSEERWVDVVADAAKARVHKVHAGPDDLARDLDSLIRAQGEPFGSTSMYAQHAVFRRAREAGIKVMLDGQGADELLAGYAPSAAVRVASLARRLRLVAAVRLLREASRLPGRAGTAGDAFRRAVPPWVKRLARSVRRRRKDRALDERWFRERGAWPPRLVASVGRDGLRGHLRELISETSLPMLLRYEDRNSMAHSIESRVPFLTPSLVDAVLELPEDYILGADGTTKAVFRDAMRGIVPDAILDRRDKIGFATPEASWLAALRPWVEAVLTSDAARRVRALDLAAVKDEWDALARGEARFDFRFWRWINVVRWAEVFDVSFD